MPKLVNLGSLCIDHVYRVPHLAGTGETVASSSHELHAGGKGLNQSLAAARAGARVVHVGCVGTDGDFLIRTLRDDRIDVDGIRILPDVGSGHAVIQVNDRGENAIVIAGGANRCLTETDITRALDALEPGDWLLLQNEINDLPAILAAAAGRQARLAFNVAPVDAEVAGYDLSCVDLLVVNVLEGRALVPEMAGEEESGIAAWLADRYPQADIVLTCGAEGLIHARGSTLTHLPAFAVAAVDETGAGDAFTGYLLGGLLAGLSVPDALRQGAAAGALAVTVAGAASAIPRLDAVRRLLTDDRASARSVRAGG
ncbi:MAG: ribokinase [Pseudomonadales bacterium]